MFQGTRKRFALTFAIMLILATLIVMGTVAAYASATDSTYNVITPLPNTIINPCNGDTIQFTGNFHLLIHETTDANGGMHVDFHGNLLDNHGVGTTGIQYVFTGGSTFSWNPTSGATDQTVIATQVLASQGPSANWLSHFLIHVTFDANGVPTATISNATFQCQ